MPTGRHFTGLLEDNRPDALKQRDYSSLELRAMGAPEWVTKPDSSLRRFNIWNQDGSSGCVSFAIARQVAVEIWRQTGVWIDPSPASIYQKRANKPGLGMFIYDAYEIVDKQGVTLNALMPSFDLSEAQLNAVPRSAFGDAISKVFADVIGSYLYLPNSMNSIAEILDMRKAVTFTLFANFDEYTDVPKVLHKSLTYGEAQINHRVAVVDRNKDPNLGNVLLMEDSWGVGNGQGGRRWVTEEFFYARCSSPVYFDKFNFDVATSTKPRVHLDPNVSLKFIPLNAAGEISDTVLNDKQKAAVTLVQDVLRYEGMFPAGQSSTGYYGALTAKGVQQYQTKYAVASAQELANVAGKTVGPKTIADINTRYA